MNLFDRLAMMVERSKITASTESFRIVKKEARSAIGFARGVSRLLRCRVLGHRYDVIEVPVQVEAEETFGQYLGMYRTEGRLVFENMIRIKRMVEPAPRELRCVRCYVRQYPRARVVKPKEDRIVGRAVDDSRQLECSCVPSPVLPVGSLLIPLRPRGPDPDCGKCSGTGIVHAVEIEIG